MNTILSANDPIIVVLAHNAYVRNLLVETAGLQQAWAQAA
jgi:hypothetical protein